MTRRDFLKLVAAGAAGVTITGLKAPSTFSSTVEAIPVKAVLGKKGGTLKVGVPWLIPGLDPQRYGGTWARVHLSFIYEGLTTPTSPAEWEAMLKKKEGRAPADVRPMLASNWEIEKGGARYVFHLKKGVKFHHGKELDSGDVEWCWKRIQDPAHQCHARKFLTHFLKSVETPDKYTVVANLSQPYGGFLKANSWPHTPIIPKDSIPQGKLWGETYHPPLPGPYGTGPFKLAAFRQKVEAVLEAYRGYRIPDLPYLDKVILKVISEPGLQTMAVKSGDIDFATQVDTEWVSKVMAGKEFYKVQILEKEGLNIYTFPGVAFTIWLNSHPEKGNSPFKDERVRQALDYCLDRAKIAATLWGRLGIPMGQGFDPMDSPWGFEDIGYCEQNIPRARQLMKEAGYPNGVDVNFSIDPAWGNSDLMAQIVQQMSRPAGFRIKIIPESGAQNLARLRNYNYHMLHYTLGGDDPMTFYYASLHTDPAEPYHGRSPALGIKDPEMDKLLDEVSSEDDFDKRKKVFKKVVLRSQEKAYWLPYVAPIWVKIWNKKVKNLKIMDYFFPEAALVEAWLDV